MLPIQIILLGPIAISRLSSVRGLAADLIAGRQGRIVRISRRAAVSTESFFCGESRWLSGHCVGNVSRPIGWHIMPAIASFHRNRALLFRGHDAVLHGRSGHEINAPNFGKTISDIAEEGLLDRLVRGLRHGDGQARLKVAGANVPIVRIHCEHRCIKNIIPTRIARLNGSAQSASARPSAACTATLSGGGISTDTSGPRCGPG
jgi:hypothetical protein